MAQGGDQKAGDGRLSVAKNGAIQRAAPGESKARDIGKPERFAVVTMRGDDIDIRVGATTIINGEQPVNREYAVDDSALEKRVRDVLTDLLDSVSDQVEAQLIDDVNTILKA